MIVFRRTNGEIAWSCDACGDEGVIRGVLQLDAAPELWVVLFRTAMVDPR